MDIYSIWLETLADWNSSRKIQFYQNITLKTPAYVFNDKTVDSKNWNDDINGYILSILASTINTYLITTVMFPWRSS